MRIRLLLKDKEYCHALKEKIGSTDKDIYVEIYDNYFLGGLEENTLIITDISPERVKQDSFDNYRERIVFLTDNPNDQLKQDELVHRLFKYSSISNLLSDISHINYLWTGENTSSSGTARVFAVCGDSNDLSPTISKALARQILFRHGGDILIIPLEYVNPYISTSDIDKSKISRLMYYIDIDKEYTADAFTFGDNYGINYLRIPAGLNPLAYIRVDNLMKMIKSLNHMKYSTIIIDIGNTFNEKNLDLLNMADNVLFISRDEKMLDIGELIDDSEVMSRTTIIHTQNNNNIELKVDDYVKRIYEISDDMETVDEKEENSNKVQRTNRKSLSENKKMVD